MAQSGLKDVPSSWIDGLAKVLAGDDNELTTQAVATARALPLTRAAGQLRSLLTCLPSPVELERRRAFDWRRWPRFQAD